MGVSRSLSNNNHEGKNAVCDIEVGLSLGCEDILNVKRKRLWSENKPTDILFWHIL